MEHAFPTFLSNSDARRCLEEKQKIEMSNIIGVDIDKMDDFFREVEFLLGQYDQLLDIEKNDTASTRKKHVIGIKKTASKLVDQLEKLSLTSKVIIGDNLSQASLSDVLFYNKYLVETLAEIDIDDSKYYLCKKGNKPNYGNIHLLVYMSVLIKKYFGIEHTKYYNISSGNMSVLSKIIKLFFPMTNDPRDLIKQVSAVLATGKSFDGVSINYDFKKAWE